MEKVSKLVSKEYSTQPEQAFEVSLKILTGFMTGAGGLVALLHFFVQRNYRKSQPVSSEAPISNSEKK